MEKQILLKTYKEEMIKSYIDLDKEYCKLELQLLKNNNSDYVKLTTVQNLRKQNMTLLLRVDMIGEEPMVETK